MKKLLILGTSLAVLLSAGIAMAGDEKATEATDTVVFQSLGSVPSDVMPMTDEALEATEGKAFLCGAACLQVQNQAAQVLQGNLSVASIGVFQSNAALVVQSQN